MFAGAALPTLLATVFFVLLALTVCSLAVDFVCGNRAAHARTARYDSRLLESISEPRSELEYWSDGYQIHYSNLP